MADYVNCLYGEPGAYGVVTKIATNTVGINNYLAGYFPAENMRFRNEAITFAVKGVRTVGTPPPEDEGRKASNRSLGSTTRTCPRRWERGRGSPSP